MIRLLITLLLACSPCFGQSNYIIEDLEKEGQVQGFKMNMDNKFDVTGGTVSGPTSFASSSTFAGATSFSAPVSFSNISTFSSDVNFTSTSSTATFSGWIDIGLVTVSSGPVTVGTNVISVDCPPGKKVFSCGCNLNAYYINQLYAPDDNTCSCASSAGAAKTLTVYAICAKIK